MTNHHPPARRVLAEPSPECLQGLVDQVQNGQRAQSLQSQSLLPQHLVRYKSPEAVMTSGEGGLGYAPDKQVTNNIVLQIK